MTYLLGASKKKKYEPFAIGDFIIKPYLMDHSAFEIAAEGKTIISTGDFCGHGRKAVCLDRFISGATQNADLLLTEGSVYENIYCKQNKRV